MKKAYQDLYCIIPMQLYKQNQAKSMNMGYFKYFLYLNYWMNLAGIYTDYRNTSQNFVYQRKYNLNK